MIPRQHLAGFLARYGGDLWVTLNFGRRVQMEPGSAKAKHLLNTVQSATYGRGWTKLRGAARLEAIGIWEHLGTNPHLHMLVRAPAAVRRQLRVCGPIVWRNLEPRGQLWVEAIYDVSGLAEYSTKEIASWDHLDRLFVYSRPD